MLVSCVASQKIGQVSDIQKTDPALAPTGKADGMRTERAALAVEKLIGGSTVYRP